MNSTSQKKILNGHAFKNNLSSSIRPVVAPFIHGLGYKPSSQLDDELLWSVSLMKAASMEMPCPENSANWKRMKVGFSYAHVSLSHLSSPRHSNIQNLGYCYRACVSSQAFRVHFIFFDDLIT